ncbi:MAG: hypothetical protein WA040_03225, partial [Anaerolineae bacterium]
MGVTSHKGLEGSKSINREIGKLAGEGDEYHNGWGTTDGEQRMGNNGWGTADGKQRMGTTDGEQ